MTDEVRPLLSRIRMLERALWGISIVFLIGAVVLARMLSDTKDNEAELQSSLAGLEKQVAQANKPTQDESLRKLTIVNDKNQAVAQLDADGLEFFDPAMSYEIPIAELAPTGLLLLSETHSQILTITPDSLRFASDGGRAWISNGEGRNTPPSIVLFDVDKDGNLLSFDNSSNDGKHHPLISLIDGTDKGAAELSPGGMSLADSDGHIRAQIGVAQLVAPSTGNTETTSLSTFTLFNKKGNVIWQMPP